MKKILLIVPFKLHKKIRYYAITHELTIVQAIVKILEEKLSDDF